MTPDSRRRLWSRITLATGLVLLALALRYTNWSLILASGPRLIVAALAAIGASGAWHLVRTLAWAACFPDEEQISFGRLFRVRLAAEAVSYVTVRGVAGEPLKVVLLAPDADARTATAAVALERLAYIVGTALIVGAGALLAWSVLPLSHAWSRAFLGLAAGSALVAVGIAGLLFGRRGRRSVTRDGRSAAPGHRSILSKAARFTVDVVDRLVTLAQNDPRRVVLLAGATLVAYALMALEAWAVFRAAGHPISFGQAVAIETFMRVASFATAVIPANLGALEAASLAAAAAVGSPTGAFLALARRIRGLFWAAVGFLLYPRTSRPAAVSRAGSPLIPTMPTRPLLLYVADDPRVDITPTVVLAGLPLSERIVRAAVRADYHGVFVLASTSALTPLEALDPSVTVLRSAEEWRRAIAALPADTPVVALGPGTLVSTMLLQAAVAGPFDNSYAHVAAGPAFPISGIVRTTVRGARNLPNLIDALCNAVWADTPSPTGEDVSHGRAQLSIRITAPRQIVEAEQTLRRAAFKPTDAKLARFNRRISLPISIALLRTPMTANMMSLFVLALGMLSAWLFSRGEYVTGMIGGVLSLAASILDGCDGEIARLKYQESALGCWLETIGDYSYYLAIFVGLSIGAVEQTGQTVFLPIGGLGLAGTVLSFVLLIFLRRRITEGRPETLHAVARARFKADPSWWSVVVWRISFVATRAAMPYGICALAFLNLLPVVVVLSAVGANIYWVSLVLKLRHLLGVHGTAEETGPQPGELAPQA